MKHFVPYLVSLLLLGLLAWLVDWTSVGGLFSLQRCDHLVLGIAWYGLSLLLRAARFQMLIQKFSDVRLPLSAGWDLTTIGTFANHVLPMRSGEAVFVVLARGGFDVPVSRGAPALLTARIYDLIAVVITFVGGALVAGVAAGPLWYAILGTLLVLLCFAALRLDVLLRLARWSLAGLLGRMGLHKRPTAAKLLAVADDMLTHLPVPRQPRLIGGSLVLSLGVWLTLAAAFWQWLASFGLPMSFDHVLVGSIGATLAGLLPIDALGSIGTLEAGWTVGFVALGMDRSDAITSGLAMHVIVIAITAILACLSLVRLGPATVRGLRRAIQNEE